MRRWAGFVAVFVGAGCRAAPHATPSASPRPIECRSVDSVAGRWRVTIFLNGARIGDHLLARREPSEPEVFELTDPEPPGLAALRPEAVDLVQFSRGDETETTFGLCPGYVAFLVTTKLGR